MTTTPDSTGPDRTSPLSAVDAARQLGLNEKTIRRAIAAGELVAVKVKGAYRIEPADLGAWHAAQAQPDTPPDTGPDRTGSRMSGPADPAQPGSAALIDHLQEEVAYLREQLAERSRELARERERGDVLQREALTRIEALTTGSGPTDAPDRPGATITPEPTPDTSSTSKKRARWKRVLGIG